jgi:tetratricopeptide (TPR) repeat protein
MSTRWPTRCLCALICGFFVGFVQAKPPDLPTKATVECKEDDPGAPEYGRSAVPPPPIAIQVYDDEDCTPCAEEAEPIDTLCPFLTEILHLFQERFDNALNPRWEAPSSQRCECRFTIRIVSAATPKEECGCPFMRVCACLADAAQICWDDLKDCVHKTVAGEAEEAEEAETPDANPEASKTRPRACPAASSDMTCPYLRQKENERPVPAVSMPMMSPLDNLKKLQKAEKLFRNAERLEQIGENAKALELYEQVQIVCPGCRFAIMAEKRVAELSAANVQDETDECVETRVAELLEACQRALADGRYEEAARCAKQAQKLDPSCVAANTLVYKMHLLLQVQERARKAERAERKKKHADANQRTRDPKNLKETQSAWQKLHVNDDAAQLQPHMPPVDDNIVQDFEQVLTDNDADVVASRCREEMIGWLMSQYVQLFKAGQYRAAEAVAREAQQVDPDNAAISAAVEVARLHALEAARQQETGEEAEPAVEPHD